MRWHLLLLAFPGIQGASDRGGKFGKCSGEEVDLAPCDEGPCQRETCVDCKFGPWSDYGPCNCEGLQDRHRVVDHQNNECGAPCEGPKIATRKCLPDCRKAPEDCVLEEWSSWSRCDKTCDGGQSFRQRQVKQNLANNGAMCDGDLKETKACGMQSCGKSVDCTLEEWINWSTCTQTCGGGQQERS